MDSATNGLKAIHQFCLLANSEKKKRFHFSERVRVFCIFSTVQTKSRTKTLLKPRSLNIFLWQTVILISSATNKENAI